LLPRKDGSGGVKQAGVVFAGDRLAVAEKETSEKRKPQSFYKKGALALRRPRKVRREKRIV
jgi:hypothetical protein